jgi:hypothetical protein
MSGTVVSVRSSFAMPARTGHPQEAISTTGRRSSRPDDALTIDLVGTATRQADDALRDLNEALRIRPGDVEMRIAFAQVLQWSP